MKVWEYKSGTDDKLSKQVEKDPSIVMTKPEMAKYLISTITFNEGDVVMEPCLGDGAFFNNLPLYVSKKYCEINLGIDYLECKENVDITLSNPPFVPRKLFWDFMVKAMDTTKREIYWLINISSLNVFTPKRLNQMMDKGWYIQNFHIVNDKRWYGRYVWIKISKEKCNTFTWCNNSF